MRTNHSIDVEIAGLGSYLPDRILSNHDLEQMVSTSDDWITQRTGIKERHLAADAQATSDLAIEAARRALEDAAVAPEDVDAIIVATCTPDHMFPATACLVQAALGVAGAMCYDLEAACTGFLTALAQGAAIVASGMCETVLVIGADALSRFVDYTDRRSCILFGDGAGAVVLRRSRSGAELVYAEFGADGSQPDILVLPAGGSRFPASTETVEQKRHYVCLNGPEVFKYAVGKLGALVSNIPEATGISLDEIKLIVPHQSNVRIIRSVCERAGIDEDKAYMNIARVGNTTAASIPLALDEAVQKGRLERGDLLLLLAFGGGLTWGSVLVRF